MPPSRLIFRIHALRKMAQRKINVSEVREVLQVGEVIEEYPDDTPYPSRLVLGFVRARPIHVVAADNSTGDETIVITAYEPDPARWEPRFRTRKTR